MNPSPLRLVAVVLLLLLCACGGSAAMGKRSPERVFYDYNSAVRWSEFETAWTFVDPKVLAERPLTDALRAHYKQVQVAGYEVKSKDTSTPGEIAQVVEVRWIDKATQTEHVMSDLQRWRWDQAAKRWWLVSGVPELNSP
jgi:hypothetical protein